MGGRYLLLGSADAGRCHFSTAFIVECFGMLRRGVERAQRGKTDCLPVFVDD